jgi:hypothetical protein
MFGFPLLLICYAEHLQIVLLYYLRIGLCVYPKTSMFSCHYQSPEEARR